MVWARTKLTIRDTLYDPIEELIIKYHGPHPTRFYKKILDMLVDIFKIPRANIHEIDYTWEKKENEVKFKVWWRCTKDFDVATYLRFDVVFEGNESNEEGWAIVTLKPNLITEYAQDSLWQQSIFHEMLRRFWHQVFYHKKRMEFMKLGRDMSVAFEIGVKKFGEELRGEIEEKLPTGFKEEKAEMKEQPSAA